MLKINSQAFREKISRLAGEFENLPDGLPMDATCRCGECDGYGMIYDESGARRCPASIGLPWLKSVTPELEKLHRELSGWEGWPPRSFNEFLSSEDFKETQAFVSLRGMWCKRKEIDKPWARFLCGNSGRGKTYACLTYLYEAAQERKKCFAFRFPDLINAYKRGFDGNDFVDCCYCRIRKANVVLVDEIGRSTVLGNQAHAQQAFQQIINLSYRQRILLITSNLSQTEWSESPIMTADLQSRLSKKAEYAVFFNDIGNDLRKVA